MKILVALKRVADPDNANKIKISATGIDTTGLDVLQSLQRNLDKRGSTLFLCDLNAQPRSIVERSGFAGTVGEDNVCGNLTEALIRAQQVRPHAGRIAYA